MTPPTVSFADAPRLVAYDVLRAVDENDAYANLELSRLLRDRDITGRDAALATELVSGTLRQRGSYDAIIASLANQRVNPDVQDALRLGAHQLLSMRVPPHAAVATTVSLVRHAIGQKPAGFVNAILRRVAQHSLEEWFDLLNSDIATRTSHPQWIVDEFKRALGSFVEVPAVLDADNEPPKVTLVARPGMATRLELGGTPLDISPYAVELPSGDPGAIPAVRDGRAGVQDAGSQLMAIALAQAPLDGRDERWLDLCAGPGGKAALLAAIGAERGAHIVANEVTPHRAALVKTGLRALSNASTLIADGITPAWQKETFDRVLVDAPCSGLGALRRRPESRWRRSFTDVEELVPLQIALLHKAIDSVRIGGVVGYATCSPVVAETAGVVNAVLAERDDVLLEPVDLPMVLNADSAALPGALQLWPHRHGTDAMFFALLRKR